MHPLPTPCPGDLLCSSSRKQLPRAQRGMSPGWQMPRGRFCQPVPESAECCRSEDTVCYLGHRHRLWRFCTNGMLLTPHYCPMGSHPSPHPKVSSSWSLLESSCFSSCAGHSSRRNTVWPSGKGVTMKGKEFVFIASHPPCNRSCVC